MDYPKMVKVGESSTDWGGKVGSGKYKAMQSMPQNPKRNMEGVSMGAPKKNSHTLNAKSY